MTEKTVNMERDDRVKFFKKMNEIRKESLTLDWETDKSIQIGRGGYRYISIYKMKRNLAPVFAKHGIEILPKYTDLQTFQVGPATQFSIKLEIRLTDVDTGYTETAETYGCAPAGDKGPTIAMSFAMKQWLSDQFMLIDGIDPEDATTPIIASSKFTVKTTEEVEAAKSKILSAGLPTEKEEKAAEAPVEAAEAPKKAEVKEEPTGESGMDLERLKAVPKPQANAIEKIISIRTQWAKDGKMSVEEYNTMSGDYLDIVDSLSAVAFIKKYKVIG